MALLLTDVVDSTQLAERLGDAAAAELGAAHDRVARDLLRLWRGREIDKTDGMLMLFAQAADAAGYALAYHAALSGLPVPLKARAGLHVGALILRSNLPEDVAHGAKPLEVEGIAKPIAARVMSLALGGQTLLTAEARAALGDTALRVQTHGHWRIKGIAEPVELFEIGDEHAPFVPPPDSAKVYRVIRRDDFWLSLRHLPNSLPVERDAFVGREDALAALWRRFDGGARLVSVLGIGGAGKTRLALRYAHAWLGDFSGGAWFCDLSLARSVNDIVQAVAMGLDVPLGNEDPVQQLGKAIAGRGACLLILDNFEQVARHAADTLGRWLDRAGDARFLVTSRELLGLPGEEALPLAPLGSLDAMALFERRAGAAVTDFKPSPEDSAAIPQLVKLLDGLPLAIELAAARVRVMPPRMLLARMDQRFKLLIAQGGRQDRQATLRATFDWSWDLLSDAEKSTLAQLSVFEGGFTLEAAEAVLDLSVLDKAHWAVDMVQQLVDKSFVRRLNDTRFDLLVGVQEYAAEHLSTPGRVAGGGQMAERSGHARHAEWYAQLAYRSAQPGDSHELGNLVAACRRMVRAADGQRASRVLQAAWRILEATGPFGMGVELALQALVIPGLDDRARARIDCVAGAAMDATGRVSEAHRHLEAANEAADRANDQEVAGASRVALGRLHASQSRFDHASVCYRDALALSSAIGDRSLQCRALNGLGSIADELGRADEAAAHYESALDCAKATGDLRWLGLLRGNLGSLMFTLGRLEAAQAHYHEALDDLRRFGDRYGTGNALCNLGAVYQLSGRLDEAIERLEEALDIARAIGHVHLECVAQCNLGLVYLDLQDWSRAEQALDAALTLARGLGDRRSEALFLSYSSVLQARRGQIDAARKLHGEARRLLQPQSDRFLMGTLCAHHAEVEAMAGDRVAAASSWDEARAIADEVGVTPVSELGAALLRVENLLYPAGSQTC